MMKVYQNSETLIEDVKNSQLDKERFYYMYSDIFFPISFKKADSEKLVVFFPGACKRNLGLPKFQRESYFSDLPYQCISLFDPTLFLNSTMKIGWFQGNYKQYYVLFIADILRSIVTRLGIDNGNILFFSTSAGCIPALKISNFFEGSNVFMGNAQTDILKYSSVWVDELLSVSYNGIENIEIYHERMNTLNYKGNSKIFYAQNIQDKLHYEEHYKPFIASLSNNNQYLNTIVYDHESRHSPLPRGYELSIIKNILQKGTFDSVYKSISAVSVKT